MAALAATHSDHTSKYCTQYQQTIDASIAFTFSYRTFGFCLIVAIYRGELSPQRRSTHTYLATCHDYFLYPWECSHRRTHISQPNAARTESNSIWLEFQFERVSSAVFVSLLLAFSMYRVCSCSMHEFSGTSFSIQPAIERTANVRLFYYAHNLVEKVARRARAWC